MAAEQSPEPLRVGAMLDVEVRRIVPGGWGMAHAAGRTIFVGLAAPGDRLRVVVDRLQGRVAFASIAEILEPSPRRTEPPCPYFGRCGGCDFQQLRYEDQLEAKREIIRDALHRIARLDPPGEIRLIPAPSAWHYRSRAQWQYDAGRGHLGYYERRTHRVCDVAACPVLVPELEETLDHLRGLMKTGALPRAPEDFQAVAGEDGRVSLAPPAGRYATREVVREIGGERYRLHASGFFQINQQLLGSLIEEALRELRGENALDLYCGVGLFTLPLARRFTRVTGVEGHPQAAETATRNLTEAALSHAAVINARVGDWLRQSGRSLPPLDLVLLDPPRAGAEPETIESFLRLAPRRISYVSCDPSTLARDLHKLTAEKYAVESIVALDLFPQTHHVETVVHLTLK